MKNYFLHATIWVQLALVSISILLGIGLIFLDEFFYSDLQFYFFKDTLFTLLTITPISDTITDLDNSFHLSSVTTLIVSVSFFALSLFLGALIAPLWYTAKRQAPKSLSPWVRNILWGELIYIGVLEIASVMWFFRNIYYYSLWEDHTGLIFIYLFSVGFPLFLLGKFLRKKHINLLGNSALILAGLIMLYGLGVSFYTYQRTDTTPNEYGYYESDDSDYDYDDAYYDDENGYDEDGGGQDYSEEDSSEDFYWNFNQFNTDSLDLLFRERSYTYGTEYYEFSPYLKPLPESNRYFAQYYENQHTLYHLQKYINRDNKKLESFWHYFGDEIVRRMKEETHQLKPSKGGEFSLAQQLEYLMAIYPLMEENDKLYKEILKIMDREEDPDTQVEALQSLFNRYYINEFQDDRYNYGSYFVRWAFTFWARRYREGNIPACLSILSQITAP